MRRKLLAAIGVAGLLAGAGFFYFLNYTPNRFLYPVRGIDVSHHQGRIDWQRVAAAGIAFAIIKATEGADHVDDAFKTNLSEARAAGLAVGAYHFFRLCTPGADQARNFIANVPAGKPLLPPVIDIEFGGNCPDRPSPEQLSAELADFLTPVEAAFGKTAIIYLIGDAASFYGGKILARPRWVRSLAWRPVGDDWVYWQYHNSGHVDGIRGAVDLDVLQGDASTLAALFGESRSLPDSAE